MITKLFIVAMVFAVGAVCRAFAGDTVVEVEKVSFKHRSHTVVGNLYKPATMETGTKYPAIIVGHPFGGVKEQTAGIYAREMAEKGFVTLAFDASHYGESGGEPRLLEDPAVRVEDYRCAVDYLSNHVLIDPDRIGVIGICGGGGYALSAAATDHRIKAVAGISTYDLGRARRQGFQDGQSYEQRMKVLDEVAAARTLEARGGEPRFTSAVPMSADQVTDKSPVMAREAYDYYRTPRGQHPNSTGLYLFQSLGLMMAFFPFDQIETISPRPILLIAGSDADTLYFSEDAFQKAAEPKELFLVPGATHVAMYDIPEYVTQAVDKLTEFFGSNL